MKICPALALLLEGSKNCWDFSRRGKNLAQKDILEFPSFAAWPMPDNIDWKANPFNNRSWQWRLHSLSFLPWLIADHHVRKNAGALDKGLSLILSWLSAWLAVEPEKACEFAWHDHGSALRAENMLQFLGYVFQEARPWADKNAKNLDVCLNALCKHGEFLELDKFYNRHTNHGLEQSRVLMLLGTILERNDWLALGAKRIRGEFAYSFTSEGVHKENSPGYHAFVLNTFLSIFNAFPDIFAQFQAETESLASRAVEFLAHAARPDGRLPLLGDTEHLLPRIPMARHLQNNALEHFIFASTRGKEGLKPAETCKIYPESGYAFCRNTWDYDAEAKNVMHLVIKGGSLGSFHYHHDEGTVLLYAFGEDWLIDSGMYSYNNDDPIRKYMRARNAHNIPVIKNAKYCEDQQARFSAWNMTSRQNDDECQIELRYDFFQFFSMMREIKFDKNKNKFKIIDEISGTLPDEPYVAFNWHIPDDKEIEVKKNKIKIFSPKTRKTLIITLEDLKKFEAKIFKGKKEDKIYSCISWNRFKYEDSICLRIKTFGKLPLKCITNFQFAH